MKKILLTLVAVFSFTIAFAQNENKYSPSTQQFLSEQKGEIQLPKIGNKVPLSINTSPINIWNDPSIRKFETRKIAQTEIYNGQEMISAFIGVENNNFAGIEALGVVLQTKFDNLAVAMIPVDKFEQLAALSNVTKIEVAEVLPVLNDRQRSVTQAFDAITNSGAAQALGITSPYTGKGVILGIIDTGIDFQHKAFKDASGNNRIVRAYKLSSSTSTTLTTYSTATQISGLTYDTNAEDHGTHTSSTAGGSSVIINGNNVTVTDDHANATYGGMAPEADLVIAGLSSLYTTSIGTAIQNICNYADQVGKPCVISLSLGSQAGAHDGTGTIASIVNQYAGNNHIIVYAASNDAMRAKPFVDMGVNQGGGMYASGTSTSSKPMLVNVQRAFSDADGNVEMLMPTIIAYARTPNVATSLKFHVVNVNTGAVVYSSNAYTSSTTISVTGSTGLAQYYKSSTSYSNQYGDAGTIRIIRTQDTSNSKYYWQIYAPIMISTSYSDNDGDGVYNSDYAFCVSVYPQSTNASTIVDMWESLYSWFGKDLNLNSSSYNYCQGNDDCSVSDNACYSKVISVGAYVTKNSITDYAGTTHDWSSEYPNIGDHASFSSWQTAGYGPLGTPLPHISAPGARIVAGINHYHTASVDDYSYWSTGDYGYIEDLVVNNSTSAYAAMEGTSMATPCVSGIIAQWLQACVEKGITPTPDYIKQVMAATWDTDEWTNGTASGAHGANTFGTHGKINAIKGIQYILGVSAGPTIIANPNNVEFDQNSYATRTYTKTLNVKGLNLEGNITATLAGNSAFSIDRTTITQTAGSAEADITITWAPATAGTQTATITLTSTGADNVVVNINGTAKSADPIIVADPTSLSLTAEPGKTDTKTFDILSEFLTSDIAVALNDANNVFSISTSSVTKAASEEGATVSVTFSPSDEGTYTGSVVLSSEGADPVTISLTAESSEGGKASDPYLDIQKYATIDEAGWRTALVNNLYKYTEYESSEVAWLTVPLYGAFVGARYATNSSTVGSGHPQTWIECDLGTSNTYGGTSWENTATATSPFNGSGTYFTSATARAIGYNSRTNTAIRTVSFYVTNTNQVMLSGTGRNGSSSTYPASLKIYECTKNADGTLTASTTATVNQSSSSTSAFTLTGNNLDTSKIYKVEASIYRGYLYEIAFRTPIEADPTLTATPSSLSFYGTTDAAETASLYVKGTALKSNVSLLLNDENGVFSISTTSITTANANNGQSVNVTFDAETEGTYFGSITITATGVEPITVPIVATATKGHVDVTIGKYGVATLFTDIPLQIPYDEYEDLLGVFWAYEYNLDTNEIRIKRIKDYIPALTGVIIQGNAGTYTFNKADIDVDELTGNLLQGSLEDIPVSSIDGTVLTLGLGSNGYVGFYKYSGTTLAANKVFLVIADGQIKTLNPMSIVEITDDVTGIKYLFGNANQNSDNDSWYTIQGLKLNGAPTQKGIYIHNGKTVIVK